MQKLEDKILLLQIKTGSEEAFSALYRNYIDRIYKYIFLKIGSRSDAEELASNVFFKLWAYVKEGRHISSIKSFLYKIARNGVVDYYRMKSTREGKNIMALEEVENKHFVSAVSVIADMEKREEMNRLEQALLKLKGDHREIIILKYIEGLNTAEIAEIVNKSRMSVRVQIHRATKALKQIWEGNKNFTKIL